MIYFTNNFPFPARGSPANGLSEVLFKTLTVEGGSDISVPRVTHRAEPEPEEELLRAFPRADWVFYLLTYS